MNRIREWFERCRSAVTGRFVRKADAEADPNTTVCEKVPKKERRRE